MLLLGAGRAQDVVAVEVAMAVAVMTTVAAMRKVAAMAEVVLKKLAVASTVVSLVRVIETMLALGYHAVVQAAHLAVAAIECWTPSQSAK